MNKQTHQRLDSIMSNNGFFSAYSKPNTNAKFDIYQIELYPILLNNIAIKTNRENRIAILLSLVKVFEGIIKATQKQIYIINWTIIYQEFIAIGCPLMKEKRKDLTPIFIRPIYTSYNK